MTATQLREQFNLGFVNLEVLQQIADWHNKEVLALEQKLDIHRKALSRIAHELPSVSALHCCDGKSTKQIAEEVLYAEH